MIPGRNHPRNAQRILVILAVTALGMVLGGGLASADDFLSTVNMGGMTGLINTPTAQIMTDASIRFGYALFDRKWSYKDRGKRDNEVWYISFNFLPRTEVSVRATVFPGERFFLEGVDDPSVDRMGSARLLVLEETQWPALALGVDDARGTRRFHSLYAVGTKTLVLAPKTLAGRASLGFGSTAVDANTYILDGGFGGVELLLRDFLSAAVEYDTEKWNGGLRGVLFQRIGLQLVALNFDTLSGGVSWTERF